MSPVPARRHEASALWLQQQRVHTTCNANFVVHTGARVSSYQFMLTTCAACCM